MRMRWAVPAARIGRKGTCIGYWYESRREKPLGRPRCSWIDNVKMDHLEIRFGVVGWNGLTQDRYRWRVLVNSIMKLRVP
jgi:hypothetical protein